MTTGIINYFDFNENGAVASMKPTRVQIHNARRLNNQSLSTTGWFLFKYLPKVKDWYNDGKVVKEYYNDLEHVLEDLTGCDKAIVAGHFARDVSSDEIVEASRGYIDKLGTGGFSGGSITVAHNDFTPGYKSLLINYLTGGDLAVENGIQAFKDPKELNPHGLSETELEDSRIMVVNIWRGTDRYPLQGKVLALCDKSTIGTSDLFPSNFGENNVGSSTKDSEFSNEIKAVNEYYMAKENPQHRWYYFPDMKMDENIILRTYDSSEENLAPCHCAFEDESTIKFAKPRRSCEARVILVFKKKQEHRNAKL